MPDVPELISVKELQTYLHIGKDKACDLVKDESFPSLKIAGRYYVLKSEFAEWLRKQGRRNDKERPCRRVCAVQGMETWRAFRTEHVKQVLNHARHNYVVGY